MVKVVHGVQMAQENTTTSFSYRRKHERQTHALTPVVHEVPMAQDNTTSFSYRKKHERQPHGLTPGFLSLTGCGLMMSIVMFSTDVVIQSFFFSGVISGAIISSITLNKLRKIIHYCFAALLVIFSGALLLAQEYRDVATKVHCGSFFSGFSFGICILTFITHGGEISVKYLRGSVLCNIQLAIDIALLIGVIIQQTSSPNGGIFAITGIAQLVFGLMAVPAVYLVYESPIFLLEAKNEQKAIKNLTELRKEPNSMTHEIHSEVEILKTILRNKSNSFINFNDIIPFVKVFACRFAYALGTSVPVNVLLLRFYLTYLTPSSSGAAFTLYIGRFLAAFIPMFLIDRFLGRKLTLAISFIGSGIFLVAIQTLVTSSSYSIRTAGLLCVFYNIFLGLGGSSVTYTYMSEIFEHSSKKFFIASIIVLEYVLHFATIFILPFERLRQIDDASYVRDLILFAGSMQIVFGILSYALLPETRGTTLLEAQDKAKRFITVQS